MMKANYPFLARLPFVWAIATLTLLLPCRVPALDCHDTNWKINGVNMTGSNIRLGVGQDSVEVEWTLQGCDTLGASTLELIQDGESVLLLSDDPPNPFTWTEVDTGDGSGWDNYNLRLTLTSATTLVDTVELESPDLDILYIEIGNPVGGSSYDEGDTISIEWGTIEGGVSPDNIELDLFHEDGTFCRDITPTPTPLNGNDSSYEWIVASCEVVPEDFFVRLTYDPGPDTGEYSFDSGTFEIKPCTYTAVWSINGKPMAGDPIRLGEGQQSVDIAWTVEGCQSLDAVTLELIQGDDVLATLDPDLQDDSFTWDSVSRHGGSGATGYAFRLTLAPSAQLPGSIVLTSDPFNIIDIDFVSPDSDSELDEGDSFTIDWGGIDGGNESDNVTLELLQNGSSCHTITTGLNGTDGSQEWDAVTCDEDQTGGYKIRLTYTPAAPQDTDPFSFDSDAFQIFPCQFAVSEPVQPEVEEPHCLRDIADTNTVLKISIANSRGINVLLQEMTLSASVASGSDELITGDIEWREDNGTWSSSEDTVATTGDFLLFTNQSIEVPAQSSKEIEVRTIDLNEPSDLPASIVLSLPDVSHVQFSPDICEVSGPTVTGSALRMINRWPAPTSDLPDQGLDTIIWCDGTGVQTSVLIMAFGEDDESSYTITSLTIENQVGSFDLVQEAAIYKGLQKLLSGEPSGNQIVLTGTPIEIPKDQNLENYEIRLAWKPNPGPAPVDHEVALVGIVTNPLDYCGDQSPFDSILNEPGRKVTRAAPGTLMADITPASLPETVCSHAIDTDGYPLLEVNLTTDDSSLEDLTVNSITVSAVEGSLSLLEQINIGDRVIGSEDFDGNSVTADNLDLNVPKAADPVSVEIRGFIDQDSNEGDLVVEVAAIDYVGVDSEGNPSCDYQPPDLSGNSDTLEYRFRAKTKLGDSTAFHSSLCEPALRKVLEFTLQAEHYGGDSPGIEVERLVFSDIDPSDVTVVRLSKGSAVVYDDEKNGIFESDELRDLDPYLHPEATFELWLAPQDEDHKLIETGLEDAGFADPDQCTVLKGSMVTPEGTLTLEKPGNLDHDRDELGSGERTVCSLDNLLQQMVRYQIKTTDNEEGELQSLTLSLLDGDWELVNDVIARDSGGEDYKTQWDKFDRTLSFNELVTIPRGSYQTINIYFEFENDNNLLGERFQVSVTNGKARGSETWPICGDSLTWPSSDVSEPSTLAFRPPGAITVDLDEEFPTDTVIPEPAQWQKTAEFSCSISDTEAVYISEIVFADCMEDDDQQAFSQYISDARLRVDGSELNRQPSIGETLAFQGNPLLEIAKGASVNFELEVNFLEEWADTGNAPEIRFGTPEMVIEGEISQGLCDLEMEIPSPTCAWHGFDLERVGSLDITQISPSRDTLFCNDEAVALAFELEASLEEAIDLEALTIRFGDIDDCDECYSGTGRLVQDQNMNGQADGGESSTGPESIDSVNHEIGFAFVEPIVLEPRTPRRLLLLLELAADPAGDRKELEPQIGSDDVTATGVQTGEPPSIQLPDWNRTIKIIQTPLVYGRYILGTPDPDDILNFGADEVSTVLSFVLTAAPCEPAANIDATISVRDITYEEQGGITNDIDSIAVFFNGAQQAIERWDTGQRFDSYEDMVSLSIEEGDSVTIDVVLRSYSEGVEGHEDSVTISLAKEGVAFVPSNGYHTHIEWTEGTIINFLSCHEFDDDPLVLPADYQIEQGEDGVPAFEFRLRGAGIDDAMVLQEVTLDILGDNLTDAFTALRYRVDDGPSLHGTLSGTIDTEDLQFTRDTQAHTFSIFLTPKTEGKSGQYKLGLVADSNHLQFSTGGWTCSNKCECNGRTIQFEDTPLLNVCLCPTEGDTLRWGPSEEVDAIRITAARGTGPEHRLILTELHIPINGVPSSLANNSSEIRLLELLTGCTDPQNYRPLPLKFPPSVDQGSLVLILSDDPDDAFVIDSSLERVLAVRIAGETESNFENDEAFQLEAPQIVAVDSSVVGAPAVSTDLCAEPTSWAPILPRVPGWASVSALCLQEGVDPEQYWVRLLKLDFEAQKEDLIPESFTFDLFSDLTDCDTLLLAIVDDERRLVSNGTQRYTADANSIVFASFADETLHVNSPSTSWYLAFKVERQICAENVGRVFEAKGVNDVRVAKLLFKGVKTQAVVPSRLNSGTEDCTYVFGEIPEVVVQAIDLANTILPPNGAVPAMLFHVEIANAEENEQINTLTAQVDGDFLDGEETQELTAKLYRKGSSREFFEVSTCTIDWNGNSVTCDVGSDDFPDTFMIELNSDDVDADDAMSFTLAALDVTSGLNAVTVTGLPIEGPTVTFVPGPCSSSNSDLTIPDTLRVGTNFSADVEIRDGSGIRRNGNPLGGVSASSFTFLADGFQAIATADSAESVTDSIGRIHFDVLVQGQRDSTTPSATLTCDVLECSQLSEEFYPVPGTVDTLSSEAATTSTDGDRFQKIRLSLKDEFGNSYYRGDVETIDVNDISAESLLADPRQPDPENDFFLWDFVRDDRPGTARLQVTLTCLVCSEPETSYFSVRVPEVVPPKFDVRQLELDLHSGQIQVDSLVVTDSNRDDLDSLQLKIVFRQGWNGQTVLSETIEQTQGTPPLGGRMFGGQVDVPGSIDQNASVDIVFVASDRDGNKARYPDSSDVPAHLSLVRQRAISREFQEAPDYNLWHFFSVPDSFPGYPNGDVKEIVAASIEAYGDARQEVWGVAEYIGDGRFDFLGKEGDKLTTIRSGRGYWIKKGRETQNPAIIKFEERSTLPTDTPLRVPVRVGEFTSIGNPFGFGLDADDLRLASLLRRSESGDDTTSVPLYDGSGWTEGILLYEFMGEPAFPQSSIFGDGRPFEEWNMAPWEAQYLWVDDDVFDGQDGHTWLEWVPQPFELPGQGLAPAAAGPTVVGSSLSRSMQADDVNWSIRLVAVKSNGPDSSFVTLQGQDGASPEMDRHDTPMAPLLGGARQISLYSWPVKPSDSEARIFPLLRDARDSDEEIFSFDLDVLVGDKETKSARIRWADVDIPDGWTATLVSVLDNRVAELDVPLEVPITVQGRPVHLTLVVGAETEVETFLPSLLGPTPETTILLPAAPSPFNKQTRLRFGLPRADRVQFDIIGVNGRRVRQLIDKETFEPGFHTILWDGRDDGGNRVASGVYWLRLRAGGDTVKRKAVFIR